MYKLDADYSGIHNEWMPLAWRHFVQMCSNHEAGHYLLFLHDVGTSKDCLMFAGIDSYFTWLRETPNASEWFLLHYYY